MSRDIFPNKVMLFVVVLISSTVFSQKKKEIKPVELVESVFMTNSSSDFRYYALSQKTSTTINIEGPGELKVYNRARLENNESKGKSYFLKYVMDDKLIDTRQIGPQVKSSKVKYENDDLPGTPSVADIETIKIPPGKHKMMFYKYKTQQKAHVRFIYTPFKKIKWQEIEVPKANKKIDIEFFESEKRQKYAAIDNKNGFKFSIENKSHVKVFFRLDFDYQMHAETTVRLVLKEEDEIVGTYRVTCQKSNQVENLTYENLVPGSLRKIFIDIPDKQKHNYELLLKDSEKSGLVRVFVNQ